MRAWACKIGEKRGAVSLVAEIPVWITGAEKRIRGGGENGTTALKAEKTMAPFPAAKPERKPTP